MKFYGTMGPSCQSIDVLEQLLKAGITGMRLNLSHKSLRECGEYIENIHVAGKNCGIAPEILIDIEGPELRIGHLKDNIIIRKNDLITLGTNTLPIPKEIIAHGRIGQELLIDDSLILLKIAEITEEKIKCTVLRGGVLSSRKSIALLGVEIDSPTLTKNDYENISLINKYGITGIMLPFTRNKKDILTLRDALEKAEAPKTRIFAKIENKTGVDGLSSFIDLADEIIIARGDLGNSMPLWQLPTVQKRLSKICLENNKPFMVVTQLLHSMVKEEIPTRAEVLDIANAVLDGASSLMLTGETAIGAHPIEAVKYLIKTAEEARKSF